MMINNVRLTFTDNEKEDQQVSGLITSVVFTSNQKGELIIKTFPRGRLVAKWLPGISRWQYQNHHYKTLEAWSPQEDS